MGRRFWIVVVVALVICVLGAGQILAADSRGEAHALEAAQQELHEVGLAESEVK